MFVRLLPWLVFLIPAVLIAPFIDTNNAHAFQFPLEIIEQFDTNRIVIYVNQSDIDKSPAWTPSEGAPPLTLTELINNIQQWISRNKDLANATIQKIELKPIRSSQSENRWYYLIQLKTQDGMTRAHYLASLMDGKILPAIREPSSYK